MSITFIGGAMSRWVEQDGMKVKFGNVAGGFVGQDINYEFPTIELATEFAALVRSKEPNGMPRGVPPEWRKYKVKP